MTHGRSASGPDLAARSCVPCRGDTPPLDDDAVQRLLRQLGRDWLVIEDHHLEKEFAFPDFATAFAYANRVGRIAEAEGHHPDILVGWGRVRLTVWTHVIDGLTESDFILAAKCEAAHDRASPARS